MTVSNSIVKNTFLFLVTLWVSCGNSQTSPKYATLSTAESNAASQASVIQTGAEQFEEYEPLIRNKRIGILTNQTGVVRQGGNRISIVDFLLEKNTSIQKIYAPEHGFRGTADAGELITDGKDPKTGLPVISLYGNNKKPSAAQLQDIDVLLFDLQDVGARFYTYISSLHYVMEACAELDIPIVLFDRPNPNIAIIDGPLLQPENRSFVGMHPVPVLHGMTIGEYGLMINGEKWLRNEIQCDLTVIPCKNYSRKSSYSLPVAPSPNLPNDKAINLYASLCFFEGTNVSSGRGTDLQFQIYGSPYLTDMPYHFTPQPNYGAKDPMHKGKICYGENLSDMPPVDKLELKWLLKAYRQTKHKEKFFTNFFVKLAGTQKLQQQIENGLTEDQIRLSWQEDLDSFKTKRAKYLMYQ